VAFVELGMWDGGTINNRFVVPKHVSFLADWNSQITQGILEINGLINTNTGCNELRPIGCSFHSCLLLGVPIYWGLVDKVQDASDRPPSYKIMVQVCIHIVCKGNKPSQWSRHVLGNELFNMAIDRVCPIKLLIR